MTHVPQLRFVTEFAHGSSACKIPASTILMDVTLVLHEDSGTSWTSALVDRLSLIVSNGNIGMSVLIKTKKGFGRFWFFLRLLEKLFWLDVVVIRGLIHKLAINDDTRSSFVEALFGYSGGLVARVVMRRHVLAIPLNTSAHRPRLRLLLARVVIHRRDL